MATDLFNGQNTHPLSHEEMLQLLKKTTLFCKKSERVSLSKKLHAMLHELNTIPTGCEALRLMLQSNETFRYDLKGQFNRESKNAVQYFSDITGLIDRIILNPKDIDSTFGTLSLAHESLHDIQMRTLSFLRRESKQAADSETMAQTMQLGIELNSNWDGIPNNYGAVYDKNYEKWLRIANNPATTPKEVPPFQPKEGVDLTVAKIEYAMQMASLETRATYIRDFVRWHHVSPEKADPPFQFTDKTIQIFSAAYKKKDTKRKNMTLTEEYVDDIISRNPFVKQKDFNPLRKNNGLKEVIRPEEQTAQVQNQVEQESQTLLDKTPPQNEEENTLKESAPKTLLANSQTITTEKQSINPLQQQSSRTA